MIAIRVQRWLYQKVFKPIFFRFDPEDVHDLVTWFGERLGHIELTRKIVRRLLAFTDLRL